MLGSGLLGGFRSRSLSLGCSSGFGGGRGRSGSRSRGGGGRGCRGRGRSGFLVEFSEVSEGIDLVLAVGLNECGEVLDSSRTRVFNRGALGAGWVELDGREALDSVGDVISSGVDLGNGHLGSIVGVVSVD